MRKSIWRVGFGPVMALLVGLAACSDQGSELLLGPRGQASESLSLADDLKAIQNGETPDLSARYASAVIGPEGGFVYVDLHYLYVPEGAVSSPTKFEMQLRDDFRIGASLSATSVSPEGEETGPKNNVGGAGFRKELYLTFSYAYARDVPTNPKKIKVVLVEEDGRLVPQPTQINRSWKTATGIVPHFSEFALAWP